MFKKRAKYGNKKVVYQGIEYDSARERDRWILLQQAEQQGTISELRQKVVYELIPKITEQVVKHLKTKDKVIDKFVQASITYECDFEYIKDGVKVVEDCKISPKMIPPEYRLKEKLFRWKYGFSIKRVYKANDPI